MFKAILFFIVILLSGCAARTFIADQKSADTLAAHPEGNRGYLMGKPPQDAPEAKPRRVPTLEIELGAGNPAPAAPVTMGITIPKISSGASHEYTVQSGDTLQKISQKLYGTTKQWHKLYLLNKDILRSPDKIHPGMTIKVIDKEQP